MSANIPMKRSHGNVCSNLPRSGKVMHRWLFVPDQIPWECPPQSVSVDHLRLRHWWHWDLRISTAKNLCHTAPLYLAISTNNYLHVALGQNFRPLRLAMELCLEAYMPSLWKFCHVVTTGNKHVVRRAASAFSTPGNSAEAAKSAPARWEKPNVSHIANVSCQTIIPRPTDLDQINELGANSDRNWNGWIVEFHRELPTQQGTLHGKPYTRASV